MKIFFKIIILIVLANTNIVLANKNATQCCVPNNYYTTVDKTWNGFSFLGNCLSGTSLSSNDIWNHYNGLYVSPSGLINTQTLKGNLWHQQNYNGFGAQNLNSGNAQFNNIFYNPNFNVTTTLMNRPIPTEIDPSSWFTPFPNGTEETCMFEQLPHGQCTFAEMPPIDDDELNEAIIAARNQTGADEFNNESRWNGRYNLYDKLISEPWWADSSIVIDSFYTAMQYSNIAQIVELEEGKEQLNETQGVVAQQYLMRANSIKLLYNNVLKIDSILDITTDSLKMDSLYQSKNVIMGSIKPLLDQNEIAYSILMSQQATKADSIASYNASLIDTNVIEGNEKNITTIELETVYKEQYHLIYNYENLIFSIANQCVLAGGKAVVKARALYGYNDPQYYFDDYALCAQAGLILRKKKGDIHLTKVFPNPANSFIEVKLFESCQKIELLNATSQVIYFSNCIKDKLLYKIPTFNFKAGFYQIRIVGYSNETTDVVPVILIH